jgi:hypothetical protein
MSLYTTSQYMYHKSNRAIELSDAENDTDLIRILQGGQFLMILFVTDSPMQDWLS